MTRKSHSSWRPAVIENCSYYLARETNHLLSYMCFVGFVVFFVSWPPTHSLIVSDWNSSTMFLWTVIPLSIHLYISLPRTLFLFLVTAEINLLRPNCMRANYFSVTKGTPPKCSTIPCCGVFTLANLTGWVQCMGWVEGEGGIETALRTADGPHLEDMHLFTS